MVACVCIYVCFINAVKHLKEPRLSRIKLTTADHQGFVLLPMYSANFRVCTRPSRLFQIKKLSHTQKKLVSKLYTHDFDVFTVTLNNNVTFIKYVYWTKKTSTLPTNYKFISYMVQRLMKEKNMPLTGWWWLMMHNKCDDWWTAGTTPHEKHHQCFP